MWCRNATSHSQPPPPVFGWIPTLDAPSRFRLTSPARPSGAGSQLLDEHNLTVSWAISPPASDEQSPTRAVTRGLCLSSQDLTTLLMLRNFVWDLIGFGLIVCGYIRDVSKYKNMIQNGQISALTDYWKHTGWLVILVLKHPDLELSEVRLIWSTTSSFPSRL